MSAGMSSVAMGNMAINIALSSSLNLLWGLVNALQLIVCIPLFNINFPGNAQIFFSMLINIAQFNVFPSQKMLFFFHFNETDPSYNDQFNNMDIF